MPALPAGVARLFDPPPSKWGLRGDPYLWEAMAERLADDPWPQHRAALAARIGETFVELTGYPLDHPRAVFLRSYDHGGLSSGCVHVPYWREELVPLLLARFDAAGRVPASDVR